MQDLIFYKEYLEKTLTNNSLTQQPQTLYEPIRYILSLGGKRLRPVLTLMSCSYFGGDYTKALNAALAVEWFHNFSLIHDDIMDEAPLRRGQETVHFKWNINTGILSGDAMLILAYQYFEAYEPHVFRELAALFSKTALEVCEGQQFDMDFETRDDVRISEYLKMIEYKTAVLVGAALKMGAIVADAPTKSREHIYEFGRNLGIAFQLQDDYLDAFGDPENFGKQVGGDILSNKKTYLYLKALEIGSREVRQNLQNWFSNKEGNGTEKVAMVKTLFKEAGSDRALQQLITEYTQKAFSHLEAIEMKEEQKEKLREFGRYLMNRDS